MSVCQIQSKVNYIRVFGSNQQSVLCTIHWLTHPKGVYQFGYFLPRCIHQILLLSVQCMYAFVLEMHTGMSRQQWDLVYALGQEVPKLVYAFWMCKPVCLMAQNFPLGFLIWQCVHQRETVIGRLVSMLCVLLQRSLSYNYCRLVCNETGIV